MQNLKVSIKIIMVFAVYFNLVLKANSRLLTIIKHFDNIYEVNTSKIVNIKRGEFYETLY